jgi:hypothetical protein
MSRRYSAFEFLKKLRAVSTARQCVTLFLLVSFLYRNDLPALVEATVGTNDVREDHGTTIVACYQIGGFQGIVCAAPITSTFGKFALWLRGHSYSF